MDKSLQELSSAWTSGVSNISKGYDKLIDMHYGYNDLKIKRKSKKLGMNVGWDKQEYKNTKSLNELLIQRCENELLSVPYFHHKILDFDELVYNKPTPSTMSNNNQMKKRKSNKKMSNKSKDSNTLTMRFIRIPDQYDRPLPCLLFSNQFYNDPFLGLSVPDAVDEKKSIDIKRPSSEIADQQKKNLDHKGLDIRKEILKSEISQEQEPSTLPSLADNMNRSIFEEAIFRQQEEFKKQNGNNSSNPNPFDVKTSLESFLKKSLDNPIDEPLSMPPNVFAETTIEKPSLLEESQPILSSSTSSAAMQEEEDEEEEKRDLLFSAPLPPPRPIISAPATNNIPKSIVESNAQIVSEAIAKVATDVPNVPMVEKQNDVSTKKGEEIKVEPTAPKAPIKSSIQTRKLFDDSDESDDDNVDIFASLIKPTIKPPMKKEEQVIEPKIEPPIIKMKVEEKLAKNESASKDKDGFENLTLSRPLIPSSRNRKPPKIEKFSSISEDDSTNKLQSEPIKIEQGMAEFQTNNNNYESILPDSSSMITFSDSGLPTFSEEETKVVSQPGPPPKAPPRITGTTSITAHSIPAAVVTSPPIQGNVHDLQSVPVSTSALASSAINTNPAPSTTSSVNKSISAKKKTLFDSDSDDSD